MQRLKLIAIKIMTIKVGGFQNDKQDPPGCINQTLRVIAIQCVYLSIDHCLMPLFFNKSTFN